jgi:hypothetical protein
METLGYILSGAAFFLWIGAVMIAVVSSPRQTQRETGAPTVGYRWRFE